MKYTEQDEIGHKKHSIIKNERKLANEYLYLKCDKPSIFWNTKIILNCRTKINIMICEFLDIFCAG